MTTFDYEAVKRKQAERSLIHQKTAVAARSRKQEAKREQGQLQTERRIAMEKYKVDSWRDFYGIETFFSVVDEYGDQCGVFASELLSRHRARHCKARGS